jgi:crotonobetainyl-CoA:carnitine CoA-transferase CaiB-like acyl-CoA transferase
MTRNAAPFGALSDIRIIDLTQMLAGPFGTMMLGDHGAQIIKVESPDGDIGRSAGPFRPDDKLRGLGGYFQSIHRNKRSVCLDLKKPEGRAALLALVKDADAITENFRAGVMDRLGLGYETLRAVNPKLVYGALRGFGDHRTGASPFNDWPAFDVVAQAMGGIMAITGPDTRTPTKVGPGVGDIVPGMMLAFGVLSAIHHARRTGEGQFIDVAMTDAVLAICERMVFQHSVQGITPGPEGNHHPFIVPFGMFPAADGFVTIAAQQPAFFEVLCDRLDVPSMLEDERFATREARNQNRQLLIQELSSVTSRFTKAELNERLGGRIPFGPVLNVAEIVTNPHYAARDMIVEVEQPGGDPIQIAGVPIKMTVTPGGVRNRAPLLGEDTVACLLEAGLSAAEVQHMIDCRTASVVGANGESHD